jgi:hypothetical protein
MFPSLRMNDDPPSHRTGSDLRTDCHTSCKAHPQQHIMAFSNRHKSTHKKAIKSCPNASSKKPVGAPLPPLCQSVLRQATAYKWRYDAIQPTHKCQR